MPVTVPLELPTVAIAVLLLLQAPPELLSDNVVESPLQIAETPVIVAGKGNTLTV